MHFPKLICKCLNSNKGGMQLCRDLQIILIQFLIRKSGIYQSYLKAGNNEKSKQPAGSNCNLHNHDNFPIGWMHG